MADEKTTNGETVEEVAQIKAEVKEEKAEATVEESEVKVPKEFKDLVEKIEKMSVLELSELVKVLEKKFGVSSVMPMMTAGSGGVVGGAADAGADDGKY